MRLRSVLYGTLIAAVVAGCDADELDLTGPQQFLYEADLSGAATRPTSTSTSATGLFHGAISVGGFLNYTISWSGLGSASNSVTINGPITAGNSNAAAVLINLDDAAAGRTVTNGTTGSASGTIDLNTALSATVSADSLRKLLDNGGLYVNIGTTGNPTGEIAGVITRLP